jgi:GxxExxY protein
MEPLARGETTFRVIGAAFEVHSVLGYGFLEKVYQRAMQVEIIKRGSSAEMESSIKVLYKNAVVGEYYTDLLVDGGVIVEIKVARSYNPEDEAQVLNELKATGMRVGMLVNFGRERVESRGWFSDASHPCFTHVHQWPIIDTTPWNSLSSSC